VFTPKDVAIARDRPSEKGIIGSRDSHGMGRLFCFLVCPLLVFGGGGWNQGQILNGEGSTGYEEFGVLDLMVSKYC
jgi:hypothetical protein